MPRKIESHMLPGPAGRLEAMLEEPEHGPPVEAALVCHPHPRHGGTMRNKVLHRIARALRRNGAVVLRFNFRGVNHSAGAYDHGEGEVEDARAALDWLLARYPGVPCTLAGFSFGSRIILRLGCSRSDAGRLIAAGFPTSNAHKLQIEKCPVRKIFIQSTNDAHGPRSDLERYFAQLSPPKQVIWVEAHDHFFGGALDQFEETVYRLGSLRSVPDVP